MSLIRPTPVADDNDDDIDFKLHRESGQAIARIRRAIRLFLFKEDAQGLDGFPRYVRRNVRVDKTDLLARQVRLIDNTKFKIDEY